jgi:hypothetical protein
MAIADVSGEVRFLSAPGPKRTCAVQKENPGRQGRVDQGVEEMGLGTVTPPLGENTPGRRLDWFLRALRGYRWGDHSWER